MKQLEGLASMRIEEGNYLLVFWLFSPVFACW